MLQTVFPVKDMEISKVSSASITLLLFLKPSCSRIPQLTIPDRLKLRLLRHSIKDEAPYIKPLAKVNVLFTLNCRLWNVSVIAPFNV